MSPLQITRYGCITLYSRQVIPLKLNNSFIALHLLAKEYNVKVLFFTQSDAVRDQCNKYGFLVHDHVNLNPFGFPVFKDMMITAKRVVKSDIFLFINSDILIYPNIIPLVDALSYELRSPVPCI